MFKKLKYAATTAAIAASALGLAACGGGGTTQGAAPRRNCSSVSPGTFPSCSRTWTREQQP